jgi:hypothetical protein
MTDLDTIIERLENWKVAIDNAIASVTALRGIEAIVPPSSCCTCQTSSGHEEGNQEAGPQSGRMQEHS